MTTRNAAKPAADLSPGPWSTWRKTSRHGRAIRFMQTYCRSPKGEGWGKPLRLAPFQKEWLEECLAPGVTSACESFPRGNGKSTFSAGLATWAGFDDTLTGAPSVPIVATTVGQAKRSVYNTVLSMIKTEPELAGRAQVFTAWGSERVSIPGNEGEIFPIANATDTLQGLDPSLALMDEIGFQPLDAWDSLLLAAGKRSRSLVLGLGTPGLDRDNALYHLRQLVEEGRELPGFVFKEYAADVGCDVTDEAQWHKANPALAAGFLTLDSLRTSLALVPESHFRIFRLGQWADGVESWLGADGRAVWSLGLAPTELRAGGPAWIGVDIGLKRDSTAVVIVQYRADDPAKLHASAQIWLPKEDEPVDVTDVMAHIRKLAKTYKVGAVSYDPRFFDVPAKMLYDEGLPMVEIPQSLERMTPAIGSLYELVRAGRITHDGNPAFDAQVLAAVPRLNERGFTLSKGKSRGRIDAAVALALAVDRAQHQKKPRAPLVVLR